MWDVLIEQFLVAERDRGLEERSVKDLDAHLGFFLHHVREAGFQPWDITPEILRGWCVDRVGDKGYSTAKAVVWSLKGLFGWLTLTGTCGSNPASPLRYPRHRPRLSLPVYLKTDQLRSVLAGSHAGDSFGDFALLSLMASTGLRSGDVVPLTRFNVHLDAQLISGRVKGGWTKRTVLSDSLTGILARHLDLRTDTSEALFLTPRGRPATPAHIRKVARCAGERAGLDFTLTPQVLRHTFGTHAADRHGRTVTQALMGHSRGATTTLYTHLSPSRFRPLMDLHPYNDTEGLR